MTVTKPTENAVEPAQRPYEKLVKDLAFMAKNDSSSFDIATSVIDKIMEAETLDDIIAANTGGPTGAEELFGLPINIIGVQWFKSDDKYKDNLGVYVVFDCFDDVGTVYKAKSGAPNVVAVLRKAQLLGLISDDKPLRLVIRGKVTANGTLQVVDKAPAKA